MEDTAFLKREELNRLVTRAAQFLYDKGADLPGMKETIERVVASNASGQKTMLLNDLIEWIDGISPEVAKEIRSQALEWKRKFKK